MSNTKLTASSTTASAQPRDATNSLRDLFGHAAEEGLISAQTAAELSGDIGPLCIAGAAGKAAEEILASDVTLLTLLIDASSSIADAGLEQAVCEGQKQLLDALGQARTADSILVALWTFNHKARVQHAYVPIAEALRLDGRRYRPSGSTALYDTWCEAIAANVAYAQQLRDAGTPCRSVVVVVTDGEDSDSRRSAKDCERLSQEVLRSEQFVLAFVGVGQTPFAAVARSMGIPEGSIAVQSQATADALRRAFRLVSQSALRVSQGLVQPGPATGFFMP